MQLWAGEVRDAGCEWPPAHAHNNEANLVMVSGMVEASGCDWRATSYLAVPGWPSSTGYL